MAVKVGIGYKVGYLTVTGDSCFRKNGHVVWNCRCKCGSVIQLDTRCLKRGTVTNCGCEGNLPARAYDLTGERFGNLVCLSAALDRPRKHGIQWKCQCDCGNTCYANTANLVDGSRTSCGCMKGTRPNALISKEFGHLTVIDYEGKKGGKQIWRCRCSCGKELAVDRFALENGQVLDCGCGAANELKARLAAKKPKGVSFNKRTGKWIAFISYLGEYHYLGVYDDCDSAVKARKAWEEENAVEFPKAVPNRRIMVVRWNESIEALPEWTSSWSYMNIDAKYMIVKTDKQNLNGWLAQCPDIHFGISELGMGVKRLYKQAGCVLEQCCKENDKKWMYYDEELTIRGNAEALMLQKLSAVCESIDSVKKLYGTRCSKKTAAKILNVNMRTLNSMIAEGKLRAINQDVDVQTICQYMSYNELQKCKYGLVTG